MNWTSFSDEAADALTLIGASIALIGWTLGLIRLFRGDR